MPLTISLAAPGSPYRLGRRVALSLCSPRPPCLFHGFSSRAAHPRSLPRWSRGLYPRRHDHQPARQSGGQGQPECVMDAFVTALDVHMASDTADASAAQSEPLQHHEPFRGQLSRNARKSRRLGRPAQVLASIRGPARSLYYIAPLGKLDLSYSSPRRAAARGLRRNDATALELRSNPDHLPEPVSLYSILARYLQLYIAPQETEAEFQCTTMESDLLLSRGYTPGSLEVWASSLVNSQSQEAAKIFEPGVEMPPFFLLLLYLRRKHIRASALGIVMRHIDHRKKTDFISWTTLKILVVRLLRHARQVWPESVPWIASLYTTEAARLHNDEAGLKPLSSNMLSDLTHFCNVLLLLLALPANIHPIHSSVYQEKAQFQVLQYMASSSPAILVTRLGFRSVTRTQLAHAKTDQEKEWAELKGPSWPPWKENRTAMDEGKGYEFGASRASKILHRMYEAGYGGRTWEQMAEVYAGWDTDYSPTIQTRTSLSPFSAQYRNEKLLRSLFWAARIRTTRTRREAWACFLAHEMTGLPMNQEVYMAMFEKLFYPVIERSPDRESPLELDEDFEQPTVGMLPGDMKEVLADPTSPLHHVFLSEPVPTYTQLYHRMHTKGIQPSNRLLAFLLETCTDFAMVLHILDTTTKNCEDGLGRLVAGMPVNDAIQAMPDYLFAAFIRFLCRFGRFDQAPSKNSAFASPEVHSRLFKLNRHYLLEYAYALLTYHRPKYRPAWTAYAEKIVQHRGSKQIGSAVRYSIICTLIEHMEQVDLDVDDEFFRLVCIATLHAVYAANRGSASIEDRRQVFLNGSSRLRTLFNKLVGAHVHVQSSISAQASEHRIPLHIPGPAYLHVYVRALGTLRDYEGLYSFSTWLTENHAEVTARAEAQHAGRKMLLRTLVSLRVAVETGLDVSPGHEPRGSPEIAHFVKAQIESVEEWGGWPSQEHVEMYIKGHLKSAMPSVGGR